jgi:hypothetical protein
MSELETRYRPKDGLETEDTGYEILVYLSGGDKTLYLNDTAAIVWRLCNGEMTASGMIDLLIEAYPESAEDIRVEVLETLRRFVEQGLVVAHD